MSSGKMTFDKMEMNIVKVGALKGEQNPSDTGGPLVALCGDRRSGSLCAKILGQKESPELLKNRVTPLSPEDVSNHPSGINQPWSEKKK